MGMGNTPPSGAFPREAARREDENPPPLLRDSPDSAAKTAAAAVQNISGAVGAADALAHATASGEAGALGVEIEAVLARMQEMMPAGVRLLDMARHGAGRDDAWRDATAAAARVRIEAMLEEDGLDGRREGPKTQLTKRQARSLYCGLVRASGLSPLEVWRLEASIHGREQRLAELYLHRMENNGARLPGDNEPPSLPREYIQVPPAHT
ncbi:hypothetical protein T484DRAFT_1834090 [Baffinella frigidus]|nr:hypothetical protein T484DRAFT_1834090 [Cryptophyta sp. CCMP2293]